MTFKLNIEKFAGKGKALGRHHGKVVFVSFGVPGDSLELVVIKETKSFIEADIQTIIEKSSKRIKANCEYFTSCGGCHHQNINYEELLKYKQNLLKEVYRKFIHDELSVEEFEASPDVYHYRNKIHLHGFQNKKFQNWGFYHYKDKKIIDISSCSIVQSEINNIFQKLRKWLKQNYFRLFLTINEIIIQTNSGDNKAMITFIGTKDVQFPDSFFDEIKKVFPNLQGIYFYLNRKNKGYVFKDTINQSLTSVKGLKKIGGDFLNINFKGLQFILSPLSFFQVNYKVAEKISEVLLSELRCFVKKPVLIDLFAGVGALSLPLSSFCKEIYGIEIVRHAAELARINAKVNNINNYQTITGDAEKQFDSVFKKVIAQASVLLLDPPRQGLSSALCEKISRSEFQRIFYLSCHPYAQVRDLESIQSKGKYRIKSIKPFDMFPQTFHSEVLVVLEKV